MAASPPLPHPLSQKGDRHSDQREESPAHIRNFTERYKQPNFHAFALKTFADDYPLTIIFS
ncbi:hypothetical protein [Viscerimonas tarda]